ncbi:MAG: flagellar protein FlgN [Pseudohongiella sp.]|nr:flagellar protein FlgN [Pseudohongiella sp.]
MISTELQRLLEKDRLQLDALSTLLLEEKACLEKRDLDTLNSLLQKKQIILATLESDDFARRQLLAKAGLKDDQTSLPNLRKLLSRSPEHLVLAELIESIESRLQLCKELTETNNIIVHRSRINTQRALGILRGSSPLTNLYTSHGATTGSNEKRNLGSA